MASSQTKKPFNLHKWLEKQKRTAGCNHCAFHDCSINFITFIYLLSFRRNVQVQLL